MLLATPVTKPGPQMAAIYMFYLEVTYRHREVYVSPAYIIQATELTLTAHIQSGDFQSAVNAG